MRRSTLNLSDSQQRLSGVTVVEVLVVIALIGLLIAILLPAIQQSRERARLVQCRNNLHQMSVATMHHESVHRQLPVTSTVAMARHGNGIRLIASVSVHARLLPLLEQQTLYEQIDFNHRAFDSPGHPPQSFRDEGLGHAQFVVPTNTAAMNTSVPVFLCPSDSARAGANNYRTCMGAGPGIYAWKEAATCRDPGNAAGVFRHAVGVRLSEIRDGLANTAMFSEQLIGDVAPNTYTPSRDAFYFQGEICTRAQARQRCTSHAVQDAQHDSFRGTTWLFGGWRQTWYNHVYVPNSAIPDCSAGDSINTGGGNGSYSARSYHPGGVNVAFADGSARLVGENINPDVWSAFATRAGGETTGEF